jgi:hypothetical protein
MRDLAKELDRVGVKHATDASGMLRCASGDAEKFSDARVRLNERIEREFLRDGIVPISPNVEECMVSFLEKLGTEPEIQGAGETRIIRLKYLEPGEWEHVSMALSRCEAGMPAIPEPTSNNKLQRTRGGSFGEG